MGRTSTNGVELFYEERNGGDPPIVFVHGWSCNHSFFAPQYDYLAGRHHVVALDLRGHGDSEVPVDGYSFATMADDVAGLCRALGLERPVLVGHSMGGAVTVELAARHRDLPRALVLVDPAPLDVTPDTGALLEQFAAQLAGPDALEQRRRLVDELLFLPSDDPVVRAQVVAQMLQPPDHVARQCFEA
ncbi:MAG TPA: alpha/beta hydrolase, partial [Acidimicrobiales bacterium]|nr:alpha/beta hydrolase [Acidimicrobiales bacterium]